MLLLIWICPYLNYMTWPYPDPRHNLGIGFVPRAIKIYRKKVYENRNTLNMTEVFLNSVFKICNAFKGLFDVYFITQVFISR